MPSQQLQHAALIEEAEDAAIGHGRASEMKPGDDESIDCLVREGVDPSDGETLK